MITCVQVNLFRNTRNATDRHRPQQFMALFFSATAEKGSLNLVEKCGKNWNYVFYCLLSHYAYALSTAKLLAVVTVTL